MKRGDERFQSTTKNLSGLLTRVIFPATCAGCGVSGTWMCFDCDLASPRIDQTSVCERCGHPSESVVASCHRCRAWPLGVFACRSVFEHSGAPRRAVHRLKYSNEQARAEWCAVEMCRLLDQRQKIDAVIVPVPLHFDRLCERGYNQAFLISSWMARLTDLRVMDALVRTKKTISQVGLDAPSRARNVRDAFAARESLDGKRIILVDDVVTTGSTLISAVAACKIAGAGSVQAVTLVTGL
jgi:ComF family protein